ncbi:hypothetical protein [Kriegella aquimaris]|uniref:Uncharacterized protein n=1 Tax=Kriegella aquimaris TaxID=192904 RepID=A0A1G9PP49_9FLAO|nr:hypothetical protein [Kriegella aquimaris]SDM00642.1 hypothetical protein SAMN04488514_10491 [Kriegella aquimaris]
MKINKNDIPITMETPGTIMRALPNYGGMTVCFNELPKGTDFTPLLQGLSNDSCHCPIGVILPKERYWLNTTMAKKRP